MPNWLSKLWRKFFPKKVSIKFELVQQLEYEDGEWGGKVWVNQPQSEVRCIYVISTSPDSPTPVVDSGNLENYDEPVEACLCWEEAASEGHDLYLWKQVT